MVKVLFLILIIIITNFVQAAELPTIAVMNFPLDPNAIVLGEGYRDYTWRDQDQLLTNEIIRVLKRSRKFNVVERSFDAELKAEKNLINLANPDSREAKRLGLLLAAQYLVFGQVESVQASLDVRPVPGSQKHTYTRAKGQIRIHLRVTDTRDGRVSAAETVVVEDESNEDLSMKFIEDLKARAVVKIVNHIIDTVYPMRLAEVDASMGIVYINRGLDGGLNVNDSIVILREGTEILDPETSETLGSRTEVICRATLSEIDEHFAVAKIDGTCPTLSIGMLCRLR